MAFLPEMPLSYHPFLPMLAIICALSILSCYLYYHLHLSPNHSKKHKSSKPTNWPVVGMLPGIFRNYHRLHDYGTEILSQNGGTFEFKGPWIANADIVLTSDPANINYILTKNFSNYPRGPEFRKIFDILGDSIFNTDGELWEIHRKVSLSVLHHADYRELLQQTVVNKLENALLPMLGNFASNGVEIDLQDILDRFTFDIFSTLILDDDPGSLSVDLPHIPSRCGFADVEAAILQRHILPESCWKLQKWLNFGRERKMSKAWEAIDEYIYSCIEKNTTHQLQGMKFSSISAFHETYKAMDSNSPSAVTKKFLRDVLLSFLVAGKDTISTAITWFFFLIAKNPSVEANIIQEMENEFSFQERPQIVGNMSEYSQKLVYLHGAICETLRLFPPVALDHRGPTEPDILPSGVSINADTKLVLFFYAMGRMESIWGKDFLEFKPERWITEQGKIKHQPSFKFVAFNSGPRTCLGKDITFTVMKMVIISVLCNYHVTLVDGHPVFPADSVVIHMKHGLKVKLFSKV